MLQLNNFKDVNQLAAIVGSEGILNALRSPILDHQSRDFIVGAIREANRTRYCVESFNDGNSEHEVYVTVDNEDSLLSEYYHTRGTCKTLSQAIAGNDNAVIMVIVDVLKSHSDTLKELSHLVGINA